MVNIPTWFLILLLIQGGTAIMVFVTLFFVSAPYGKHNRKGWGPALNSKWAWMSMEFPAFAVMIILYVLYFKQIGWVNWIFLGLWLWHYINRTFIFSTRLLGSRNNFPLSVALMAFIFNLLNATVNGYYLAYIHPDYSVKWLTDWRFIIGLGIFFSGWFLNIHSDRIIRNIRRDNPQPGYYEIPEKGFFKWISNPNYLGEIIEWTGWALLTWSFAGLAFALFTFANLLPRAIANHIWYRQHFTDYPKNRKILIPGIF